MKACFKYVPVGDILIYVIKLFWSDHGSYSSANSFERVASMTIKYQTEQIEQERLMLEGRSSPAYIHMTPIRIKQ